MADKKDKADPTPKEALTYEASAALMQDFAFRGRVKVAGLHWATYVINEPIETEAHSARYRYAQQWVQQPENVAAQIQPMVVMDGGVQAEGAAISDAGLQGSVEAVINKFL